MVCSCRSWDCPTHFGYHYEYRWISWILEFVQHFCSFIIAYFCIHVEYIRMIRKILGQPPLQMTNLARKRTNQQHLLWRSCTGKCISISVVYRYECLSWFVVKVRFRIFRKFITKHWQKFLSEPEEVWRIDPSIEWPFIEPLSSHVVAILGVSQHLRETCLAPSMNHPCTWYTPWSDSFHTILWLSLHFLSPLKINEVCIFLWYPNKWFSIGLFRFWPPSYCPWLGNPYHPVGGILLSLFVFCPDSMHHTFHSRIQCVSTMLSITVSCSGSSGAPENSHIVW